MKAIKKPIAYTLIVILIVMTVVTVCSHERCRQCQSVYVNPEGQTIVVDTLICGWFVNATTVGMDAFDCCPDGYTYLNTICEDAE